MLGTITVALIGLVALEMFGPLAGLIALILAAVYPVGVELAETLVAENLLAPLVLAAVYAGLRVRRASTPVRGYAWIAGAGVLTGLATLTHENAALILLPLIAAVWIGRPALCGRARLGPGDSDPDRSTDHAAVDDPQRGGHAPLHPGLRRDRDHPGRHLQRGVGGQPAGALQVANLLRHPRRARADPPGRAS